ncbi:MAG: aldo/keto reductase [Mogibacterium sp.]|nr:aldo/keto reductase [Mogibacterium sp.]MBR0400762.1 aldo/keto reductase [Mogibacterium sp.]
MRYRQDRYGNELSQLGYGCMRFTKKGSQIDYEKAEREVLYAIEHGVNYFDTAYAYMGSEECLGRILEENGVRDKVNIATKLPQYLLRSMKVIDKTFREELRRLRTDHIDYYLMHMFTDLSEWERLQSYGIEQWIADRKAEGSIRQIGFSYHGDTAMFLRILDAYDWDFCQVQYNYLDENSQAGRKGVMAAAERGIPVIIMEPLRGGKLVDLPVSAKRELRESGTGYSAAELGLRWLWDQNEVTVVLSGMNSLEMVEENIRIASDAAPGSFTDSDRDLIDRIRKIIKEKEKVGCTGCRYCMPCPQGIDIPGTFYYYNLMYIEKGKNRARFEYLRNVGMQKDPIYASACVRCGKCEQHCPQHIQIRDMLRTADRDLRPLAYRAAMKVVRKAASR